MSTAGSGFDILCHIARYRYICRRADGNITINGGMMNLTSTGAGGKGINGDGTLTATGGTMTIKTSGNAVVASSNGSISTVNNSQQLDRYKSD